MNTARISIVTLLASVVVLSSGCGTTRKAYYNTWEKFGYAKRERLVDNVKAARQEQVEAKKQFASALDQFKSVVNFQGGDLENLYNKLNKEYQRCEGQAGDVRSKIASVKNVATALFDEWEDEVKQIKDDPSLQRKDGIIFAIAGDNAPVELDKAAAKKAYWKFEKKDPYAKQK